MRSDYAPFFQELKQLVAGKLDGVVVDEKELTAVFMLPSGWILEFECEKIYGPSWNISLKDPSGKIGYSVWLLMKIFEGVRKYDLGPPTIRNQIDFISREAFSIFNEAWMYRDSYIEIDR